MTTHEIVLSDEAFLPIEDGRQRFLIIPTSKGVTLGDRVWLRESGIEGPTGRELVCSIRYVASAFTDGIVDGFTSVGIDLERRIKGSKQANHGEFGCPFCKDKKSVSQITEGTQITLSCGNCGANWRIQVDIPPTKITLPPP